MTGVEILPGQTYITADPAELDVAIRELLERMRREEEDAVDKSLCACLCGTVISTKRRKRYVSDRHRDARYKARVQAVADLRGVRAHHSLKTLREGNGTSERRRDAQTRRNGPQAKRKPRPGVTVYFPTVDSAVGALRLLVEHSIATPPPAAEHRGELPVARDALERAIEPRRRRDASPTSNPTTPGGQ